MRFLLSLAFYQQRISVSRLNSCIPYSVRIGVREIDLIDFKSLIWLMTVKAACLQAAFCVIGFCLENISFYFKYAYILHLISDFKIKTKEYI